MAVVTTTSRPWAALIGISVTAAAVRIPFVGSGLGADEGGYAAIARAWADGAPLYSDAWVDRPQGLMVAYRGLLSVADSAVSIRVGAVLAGVGISVLLYEVARRLKNRRAGLLAASVYALVGVAPQVEGFSFNGELVAGPPTVAAIAAALAWNDGAGRRWLPASGACAAAAMLCKQSAFDGLLVVLLVVVLGRRGAGARLRVAGGVALGAAPLFAVAALHGARSGWSEYWTAVVGYRWEVSLTASDRWSRFERSVGPAWRALPVAWVLGAATFIGAVVTRNRALLVAVAWLVAAALGFAVGGGAWPHYYVQLLPPLCLAVGLVLAPVRWASLRLLLVMAVAAPALVFVARTTIDGDARLRDLPFAATARADARVGAYLRSRTRPDDTVYALMTHAGVYFHARRRAALPYLWAVPLHAVPGGMGRLRRVLTSPNRPKFVVVYQPAWSVDPTGEVGALLGDHYAIDRAAPFRSPRILQAMPITRKHSDASNP
ncbi:glycosyltransferase family 39 protein [Patulibacter sp. NPDC049589]|uniref:glycosyltransferase family 39 protein n=1 Tax=Patulibacter sp. NPDC049589 TaxID=3154731 RepID=UPI003426FE4F